MRYLRNREEKKQKEKSKKQDHTNERKTNSNNNNNNTDDMNDSNNLDKTYGKRLKNKPHQQDNWHEEKTGCEKAFPDQHGKPAMMIFRCGPHSVCVGRHVMTAGESVNDMFSFLSVFYKKMPNVMIADFCCNLMSYAMNRAPGLWERVMAAIDTIHGETHVACSTAFCIKVKKKILPEWARLEDEGVEQKHVELNRFRVMSPLMSLEFFMLLTEVMLAISNRRILRQYAPNGISRKSKYKLDRNNPRSWADQYDLYNDVDYANVELQNNSNVNNNSNNNNINSENKNNENENENKSQSERKWDRQNESKNDNENENNEKENKEDAVDHNALYQRLFGSDDYDEQEDLSQEEQERPLQGPDLDDLVDGLYEWNINLEHS